MKAAVLLAAGCLFTLSAAAAPETPMEWTFEEALKLWPPMTKAVQHVGVPGCQWQAGVYWDGSLIFGQTLHRSVYRHPRMEEEVALAGLGDNMLHLSVAFGSPLRFADREGTNSPLIRRWLEGGTLPIPHIETRDGDLLWHETVFAHLLGRRLEEGMTPRPDYALAVQVKFAVLNTGRARRTGHLWLHFGDTSQTRSISSQLADLAPPLPHTFESPFGRMNGKVRYLLPVPSGGKLTQRDTLPAPEGMKSPAKRAIEWEVPLGPGERAELRLILPYGLADPEEADRLLETRYEELFEETRSFWKKLTGGPGQILTPDLFLNDYLASLPGQMAQQIGYRRRAKLWMYKTSPNWYEDYYPANAAKALAALDLRGLTSLSDPVLKSFLDFQSDDASGMMVERSGGAEGALSGRAGLGGEGFARFPGFFGNFGLPVSAVPPGDPRQGWTANISPMCHGAILQSLASHYRITRDDRWLREGPGPPLRAILEGCEWIRFQRKRTLKGSSPYRGLLPPASAHDWLSGSTIFNDAWCIWGMAEAVRLLHEIGHPRAREFASELADYRRCLRDRYREARDRARPLPLPDGSLLPFVPRMVSELDWARTDSTYTGYGPLRAGGLGALDPRDELVGQALAFAEAGRPSGGDPRLREHFTRHWVEPETHWPMHDLFLARDDLPRFFELLFNNLAAAVHRDFRVGCEARDGVVSCAPGDAERWQMVRKMFVHERGGYDGSQQELFLLQALPRSWLLPGSQMAVREMGTAFGGKVSLSVRVLGDGGSVSVRAKLSGLAVLPKAIRMRLRSGSGLPLKAAWINGKRTKAHPGDTILLPSRKDGDWRIVGRYE